MQQINYIRFQMMIYYVLRSVRLHKWMKKTFFNSVTELSKHLGISRKTLYERAKRDGIELHGSYTQNELDSLRIKGNKSVLETKVNDHSQKRNRTET